MVRRNRGFVTHDRYFLDNVAMDFGDRQRPRGTLKEITLLGWIAQRKLKADRSRNKQSLAKERERIQMGTKKRSMRNKARVKQNEN